MTSCPTSLLAIDVLSEAGGDKITALAVRLNTINDSGTLFHDAAAGRIITGAEIVDAQGLPLQGIKVCTVNPEGNWLPDEETSFYWNSEEKSWSMLQE